MSAIAKAMVAAQKEFGPALKTSTNPHFRSRYADLSACIEAVIDALNNNGIMLMQGTYECDTGVIVETVFIHESGEKISGGKLHVPAAKNDPQGYGSALTYARRYSLQAACGIAPEDDDANAATAAKNASPTLNPPFKTAKVSAPSGTVTIAPKAKVNTNMNDGEFSIKTEDVATNLPAVILGVEALLVAASSEEDLKVIFQKNKKLFDEIKATSEDSFAQLMEKFSETKEKLNKGK